MPVPRLQLPIQESDSIEDPPVEKPVPYKGRIPGHVYFPVSAAEDQAQELIFEYLRHKGNGCADPWSFVTERNIPAILTLVPPHDRDYHRQNLINYIRGKDGYFNVHKIVDSNDPVKVFKEYKRTNFNYRFSHCIAGLSDDAVLTILFRRLGMPRDWMHQSVQAKPCQRRADPAARQSSPLRQSQQKVSPAPWRHIPFRQRSKLVFSLTGQSIPVGVSREEVLPSSNKSLPVGRSRESIVPPTDQSVRVGRSQGGETMPRVPRPRSGGDFPFLSTDQTVPGESCLESDDIISLDAASSEAVFEDAPSRNSESTIIPARHGITMSSRRVPSTIHTEVENMRLADLPVQASRVSRTIQCFLVDIPIRVSEVSRSAHGSQN